MYRVANNKMFVPLSCRIFNFILSKSDNMKKVDGEKPPILDTTPMLLGTVNEMVMVCDISVLCELSSYANALASTVYIRLASVLNQ